MDLMWISPEEQEILLQIINWIQCSSKTHRSREPQEEHCHMFDMCQKNVTY